MMACSMDLMPTASSLTFNVQAASHGAGQMHADSAVRDSNVIAGPHLRQLARASIKNQKRAVGFRDGGHESPDRHAGGAAFFGGGIATGVEDLPRD